MFGLGRIAISVVVSVFRMGSVCLVVRVGDLTKVIVKNIHRNFMQLSYNT